MRDMFSTTCFGQRPWPTFGICSFVAAKLIALPKRFYVTVGRRTGGVDPGIARVRTDDAEHSYARDDRLKDVVRDSTLHVAIEGAQAYCPYATSILSGGEFPEGGLTAAEQSSSRACSNLRR
jgi:hypothetical protein